MTTLPGVGDSFRFPIAYIGGEANSLARRCTIAYRLHFERANLAAIEAAQSGRLSDLGSFNSEFSMNVRQGNIRTQSERAGGPLYDIGIYCINAARYLFRAEPLEVSAMFAQRPEDERFAEVEEGAAVLMRFPDDRLASFIVSSGAAPVASYRIVGTRGDLLVDNAYEYTEDIVHTLTIDGRTRTRQARSICA